MKYVVSWTYLMNGSGAENEAAIERALRLFAAWTPPSGTTFHQFVNKLDGAGGFAVVETDNPTELADLPNNFGHFIDVRIDPVIDMTEATQMIQQSVEFRK
ncbi:DUF3303 domain-containing protein, partial [Gordonia rhizosphera]